MPTKEILLNEALDLGLEVTPSMTKAQIQVAIDEADEPAPVVDEPSVAVSPAAWAPGKYRAVCGFRTLAGGEVEIGDEVNLDAEAAASLGRQGAIERI